MKKIAYAFLGLVQLCAAQPSLLLIDTQGKQEHYYRNILLIADSVGFKTDYRNVYQLLENPDINSYDAILFMLSPSMLNTSLFARCVSSMHSQFPSTHAYITQQCMNILTSFIQQKNKGVGLLLPGRINYPKTLADQALQTIMKLGDLNELDHASKDLIASFVTAITQPDNAKGALLGTSLLAQEKSKIIPVTKPNTPRAHTTPLTIDHFNPTIQQLMPIGLLINNQELNTIFFISKSSEFDFADTGEHFFKNPINITERNELLKAAQESLLAFKIALDLKKIPANIDVTVELPEQFTPAYLSKEMNRIKKSRTLNNTMYGWITNKPLSCAWLDPYDFFGHEDGLQKIKKEAVKTVGACAPELAIKQEVENIAIKQGMKVIYDGGFNLLWFEFIPEWYLSPHGLKKEQRAQYVQRIHRITDELKTYFGQKGKMLPKVFLGMNITSNFKSHPVANPVQDIFGNTYSKIPCPFDIGHFWKPEVLDVFDIFITIFGKSLPITGVFFDFEMYHAPEQTGLYTDHMDFSDLAWKVYCLYTKNTALASLSPLKERVIYLQTHKKFTEYFTILEEASRDIGIAIKTYMRKKMPHLIFAAYTPTLPYSWFYRGIMAGLSSPQEPLLLATFNTDYASHDAWLKSHHINILHGSAIMLSKLHHTEDLNLITSLLTHHDFVWYNRPSRMIYQYNTKELQKTWWGIEASPVKPNGLMRAISMQHIPLRNRPH